MKSVTKYNRKKQFQQALFGTTTLLLFTPLLAQVLPAQALPIGQPMQVAMDNCIMVISTASDSYIINVCGKANKTIEMVLDNRKTGEKLTFPATQLDDAGNVFRGSLRRREKINSPIPIYVPQVMTFVLDVNKKQFSITKEINMPGNPRKSTQVEKLGGILMSSIDNYRTYALTEKMKYD